MDYAEARAAFFQPRDAAAAPPGTAGWQSPARQLRDAIEPVATICFWSEAAYEAYAERGLDFLTGYVGARGCVLGEPDGSVVAAAFGVFEPGLIGQLWDGARQACDLAGLRAAREAGAVAALRAALGAPCEAEEVAGVLRRGAQAADVAGRPLFAGNAGLAWPADPLAQLWLACSTLRELRGDSHLAACVTAGLTGLEANLVTELQVGWSPQSYAGTRGWAPEAMTAAAANLRERGLVSGDELTDAGRQLRAGIEEATDRQLDPVLAAIGANLTTVLPLLEGWSQAIIDRGWFPPDPYKRASG